MRVVHISAYHNYGLHTHIQSWLPRLSLQLEKQRGDTLDWVHTAGSGWHP